MVGLRWEIWMKPGYARYLVFKILGLFQGSSTPSNSLVQNTRYSVVLLFVEVLKTHLGRNLLYPQTPIDRSGPLLSIEAVGARAI